MFVTDFQIATPLVQLRRIAGDAKVLVKLESNNVLSSVKDRIGRAMVRAAEATGALRPGMRIIEPTSGNTGIALAYIAASAGYGATIVMPQSVSEERKRLLTALGAELVLTSSLEGMAGAIRQAYRIHERGGYWMPMQFENPANPQAHEGTTGPEIWSASEGHVDIFVAGVGTGGTLTGVGRYLRRVNPAIKLYAVEPEESPAISLGRSGRHGIHGIGAGFVPANLDIGLLDEVIRVSTDKAIETAREVSRFEGLAVGISSGANIAAALRVAAMPGNEGANVVTVAASAAERYLSTPLFSGESPGAPGLLEQAAHAMGIHFSI